jgi:phenylacetate-CoA ligase
MSVQMLDEDSIILLQEAARAGLKTSQIELSLNKIKSLFGCIETEHRSFIVRAGTIYERSPVRPMQVGHPLNGSAAETTMSRSATRAVLALAGLPTNQGRALKAAGLEAVFTHAKQMKAPLLVAPDDRELGSAWLCSDTGGSFQNVVGMLAGFCETLCLEDAPAGRTFRFYCVSPKVVGVREIEMQHPPAPGDGPVHLPEVVSLRPEKTLPHASYFTEVARVFSAFPTLKYGSVDLQISNPEQPAGPSAFQIATVQPSLDFSQSCCAPDGGKTRLATQIVRMLASLRHEGFTDPILEKQDQGVENYDHDIASLIQASRELGMDARMITTGSKTAPRRTLQLEIASTPVQFRNGATLVVNEDGRTTHINEHARKITSNKQATRQVLESAGLSTPQGRSFTANQLAEALVYADELGYPICVKPTAGSGGRSVRTGLKNSAEVAKAFREAANTFNDVVLERSVDGEVVRISYLAPDIYSARYQDLAAVFGDGESSVVNLIEQRNAEDHPGQPYATVLSRSIVTRLANHGTDLADTIPKGEKLVFAATSHLLTGVRAESADDLHPSFLENARAAFQAIKGISIGSMDMIVKDPQQPATPDNHWILEINSSPTKVMFFRLSEGARVNGCGAVLRHVERVLLARKSQAGKLKENTVSPEPTDNQTAKITAALAQMERAQPIDVARIQEKQLERILRHAWQHTRFYHSRLNNLFEGGHFRPEAWGSVPLLTRKEAQEHRHSRRAFELEEDSRTFVVRTSGSSGAPLDITWNRIATIASRAVSSQLHRWHNLDIEAPIAEIKSFRRSGYDFPGGRGRNGWSLCAPDAIRYRLAVSTPVHRQLDWLSLVRVPYLATSPTMARELALEAIKQKRTLRFEAVLTAGEVLTPEIRQLCHDAFGARIIDSYACQEMGKLAIQCDQSDLYHICASNVLFEVLDDAGEHVAPGESGRVVLTSLYNYAMPFIRYEIGDYARLAKAPCKCGRSLPAIESVQGRRRNMVILPDGNRRWIATYILAELGSMVHAERSRLVQTATDQFELQFVASGKGQDFDPQAVAERAREMIHPQILVTPVRKNELKRSAGGKFEDVIGLEQTDM